MAASASAQQVDEIASAALAELPGKTAFLFAELSDSGPKPLFALRADERFAVGSSFKLFILGELIEEANEGRRRAADVMLLRADRIGPPASELAGWPTGSPITLHTLALKMISISDNTATDHLLYLLGREQVEARMAAMGHGAAQLNRPLLSTREMTMLRDKREGMPGRAYQKLNEQERRQFLQSRLAAVPDYDKLDFDTASYDLAEWYASPMDMAHALNWIYLHTKPGQPAALIRDILAVDPKLPHDRATWPFVGFKGGSEDQLLAGNWLLKNRNGNWYSFHVFCNSPRATIEPEQLMKATMAIFAAIEKLLGDGGRKN
ncbi:MAG TPA: serine hydrolase [Pirellulales bacterium]